MNLSKKELVMSDIIQNLKNSGNIKPIDVIYQDIIKNGKFRNFLTTNKFSAIVTEMTRMNIVERREKMLKIAKNLQNLSHRDILAKIITHKWPTDLEDGLR